MQSDWFEPGTKSDLLQDLVLVFLRTKNVIHPPRSVCIGKSCVLCHASEGKKHVFHVNTCTLMNWFLFFFFRGNDYRLKSCLKLGLFT